MGQVLPFNIIKQHRIAGIHLFNTVSSYLEGIRDGLFFVISNFKFIILHSGLRFVHV